MSISIELQRKNVIWFTFSEIESLNLDDYQRSFIYAFFETLRYNPYDGLIHYPDTGVIERFSREHKACEKLKAHDVRHVLSDLIKRNVFIGVRRGGKNVFTINHKYGGFSFGKTVHKLKDLSQQEENNTFLGEPIMSSSDVDPEINIQLIKPSMLKNLTNREAGVLFKLISLVSYDPDLRKIFTPSNKHICGVMRLKQREVDLVCGRLADKGFMTLNGGFNERAIKISWSSFY